MLEIDMHRNGRWYQTLVIWALLALAAPVAAERQFPVSRTDQADQIAAWVRDLDADNYAARKVATDRLIEVGEVAADPLAGALAGGSRELIHRAIHVLDRMARSSDASVAEAAQVALRKAANNDGPGASGARYVLSEIQRWQQHKALAQLRDLGAKVYFREFSDRHMFTPLLVESNRLIIDANWKGQPDDLKLLKMLTNLQDLQFEGPQITDTELHYVALVPRLERLTLKRTRVTDAGLADLAQIPQLRQVSLIYTPVTDKAAAHFEAMPALQRLELKGTRISRQTAERLAARLGLDNVDFHRGAFLGIEGGDGIVGDGCPVMRVTDGSAAQRAGVTPGDIIVSIDGDRVDRFDTLKALLADRQAGDKIKLEMRRRQATLSKEVVLGEWQ